MNLIHFKFGVFISCLPGESMFIRCVPNLLAIRILNYKICTPNNFKTRVQILTFAIKFGCPPTDRENSCICVHSCLYHPSLSLKLKDTRCLFICVRLSCVYRVKIICCFKILNTKKQHSDDVARCYWDAVTLILVIKVKGSAGN